MNKRITIAGREVNIAPIKIKALAAFVAAVEPIAKDLADGDIIGALARNTESLINAVSIGAGVERAWLDEQDADVLVALAAEVIEVNADFFVQRILPLVEQASETLSRLSLPEASTPSSEQAIA